MYVQPQQPALNPFAGTFDYSQLPGFTPEMESFRGREDLEEILELYEYGDEYQRREIDLLLGLQGGPENALLPHQIVPFQRDDWEVMALEGGRGLGKTCAGATACIKVLRAQGRRARVFVGAPTNTDARDTCIEGEALALDTPIPTPAGWKTMGQLRRGDYVFDENGKPCRVVLESSVKAGRPCYRVKFSDGAEIITDEGHKWLTWDKRERNASLLGFRTSLRPQVRTTVEIRDTLRYGSSRKGRKSSACNHSVGVAGPLQLPARVLPIDPYVLGVWLGDGHTRGGCVTSADSGIVRELASVGFVVRAQANPSGGAASDYGVLGLQVLLRDAGLIHNKHVPPEYLRAGKEQRLALLQGLMDTDGYVSERGQCAFDNTNLGLVRAAHELVASLGVKTCRIRAKKNPHGFKTIYRLTFTTALPVFRLARKLFRLKTPASPEARSRYIQSVEPVESVPVKCIAIDSPTHLYLAGREMIPTHNSGLYTLYKDEFKTYNRSLGQIELRHKNGGWVRAMGTEKPKRWNGGNWSWGWFDEYALCNKASILDAQLALRSGPKDGPWRARMIVTFTPKGQTWTRDLMKRPDTYVPYYIGADGKPRRPTTFDNPYLPQRRVELLKQQFLGTRLGNRELLGHELYGVPGALWNEKIIRHETDPAKWSRFTRIVVAIDPAGTAARKKADENSLSERERKNLEKRAKTSICVKAKGIDGRIYTLAWVAGHWTPTQWAEKAVDLFRVYRADRIVAEKNFGGLMVESTLRMVWADAPITLVNASDGKRQRAEPVVSLYEQGREIHCLVFAEAESQLCAFIDSDHNEGADYVDSGVWATWELMGWNGLDFPGIVVGQRDDLVGYVVM